MSLTILRPLVCKNRAAFCHLLRSSQLQVLRLVSSQPEKQISTAREEASVTTEVKPLGERVKETTKTASYMGVIVIGVGVTGIMFWAIFRELFSSKSPNNVYADALDRCIHDPKIQDSLGAPIKGFGEETRRGRRTHAAHSTFVKDGIPYIRMQFYIQGIRNKATVLLEKKLDGSNEYRYLFAQLDYYPHSTIILEDNRAVQDAITSINSSSFL